MSERSVNNRYSRQAMLPEIGEAGQRRLCTSSVLIVGLGGLGCPVALYLAGAGVGRIGLADHDVVSESNLHRQLLYTTRDIGLPKAECAAGRLSAISPCTVLETHPQGISPMNASDIIASYDVTVDCSDNFATRYLLDSVCSSLGKTWIHASIEGFAGITTTFTPECKSGYADLFPDCGSSRKQHPAAKGVIGPTAGDLGAIEAAEAIKVLAGIGPGLAGKLFTIDLLSMNTELHDF